MNDKEASVPQAPEGAREAFDQLIEALVEGRGPMPEAIEKQVSDFRYALSQAALASVASPAPAQAAEGLDDDYSIQNCIAWLDAKYSQHREYEDKAAADHLRAALAASTALPSIPTREMLAAVDDMTEDKYLSRGRAVDMWQRMVAAQGKQFHCQQCGHIRETGAGPCAKCGTGQLRSTHPVASPAPALTAAPIATAPENHRVIVYSADEMAMAWFDRIDRRWYYAPQGGLLSWEPTHWRLIPCAFPAEPSPPETRAQKMRAAGFTPRDRPTLLQYQLGGSADDELDQAPPPETPK